MSSRDAALATLEQEMAVVHRRLRRAIDERASAIHPELRVLGYQILLLLHASGAQRGSEVQCYLGADKGAVSREITHLIGLGLIAREPDPADGRAWQLDLTELARATLSEVVRLRRAAYGAKLADWRDEELEQLADLLQRYNRSLEPAPVTSGAAR